jgi:hypothetical protein
MIPIHASTMTTTTITTIQPSTPMIVAVVPLTLGGPEPELSRRRTRRSWEASGGGSGLSPVVPMGRAPRGTSLTFRGSGSRRLSPPRRGPSVRGESRPGCSRAIHKEGPSVSNSSGLLLAHVGPSPPTTEEGARPDPAVPSSGTRVRLRSAPPCPSGEGFIHGASSGGVADHRADRSVAGEGAAIDPAPRPDPAPREKGK